MLSPNNDEEERVDGRKKLSTKARRRSALGPKDIQVAQISGRMLDSSQIKELYSNCIKLASENKINQKNTWSLQLIDHINDLVKPSEEDGDQTNFQKASCTLDAGVKIYSYRVDSVHNETFKVLGGLNRTSQNDEGEENDKENSGESVQDTSKKRRGNASAQSTLEASFEALNVKKFDVTFSVDPLFHKTSAQFDEGGAKGLLLHNLHVHRGCQLVFDSSEVPDYENEEVNKQKHFAVDLSSMGSCLSDIRGNASDGQIAPLTDSLRVMLGHSTRAQAEDHAASIMLGVDTSQLPSTSTGGASEMHAFGTASLAEDDDEDDFGDAYGGFDDSGDEDSADMKEKWAGSDREGQSMGVDIGSGHPAPGWLKALEGSVGQLTSTSSWAGASHWRYRLPKTTTADSQDVATRSNMTKSKQKTGPLIDFENLPEVPKGAFDLARKTKQGYKDIDLVTPSTQAATLLPRDLHYQAVSLARLFLKPFTSICTAPRKENAADDYGFGYEGASDDEDDSADFSGVDWSNQWEPSSAELGEGEDHDTDLLQAPRQVGKIEVSYARQAKQVDVRILKKVVWKLMQEQAKEGPLDADGRSTCSFEKVIASLPQDCAAGAAEDISVHLCFICLLHLCNEHNLALSGREDMSGLQILHVPVSN